MNFDYKPLLKTLELLEEYNIKNDEVIFVGGTLFEILGLRKAGDVDVIVKPNKRKYLESISENPFVGAFEAINLTSQIQVLKNPYRYTGINDDQCYTDELYRTIKIDSDTKANIILPELEFGKKLFRDREKDKRDVILLQRYALQSKDWNWGLIPTSPVNPNQANTSKRHSLPKKIIKYALKGALNPRKGAKKLKSIVNKRFGRKSMNPKNLGVQIVDIGTLLQWQMLGDEFLRYDTLLRYLVASSYLNNNSKDIEKYYWYYNLMQEERVNRSSRLQFDELIKSVQRKGYQSDKYPLVLDSGGRLIDGSHRLSCALALGIDKVPVRFSNSKNGPTDYGKDWFLKRRFPSDLINQMDYQLNKLFITTGCAFVIVLWPPAQKFSTEIKNLVESRFSVLASQENQRVKNFHGFLESTYLSDDIEQWKIHKKHFHMKNYEPVITYIVFQINDPAYRMKARTESYLSDSVAKLKKEIRNKYRDKVENYVHDIIVHIGDNPSMNRDMIRCLNNYGVKVLDEQKVILV